ncbi:MAG TPA: trehalose-6-phosphate synthase, partial [Edaphobacter sp.]|nr:trehalose-6-phosphate synthase [Edaphobacter sp.]
MRILSLRLIVALIVGVTLVSLASSWYQVQAEKDAMRHDLERKAETFGESLAGNAESYLQAGDKPGLERMVQRFSNRDHLLGIGVYDRGFSPLAVTRDLSAVLRETPPALTDALASNRPESRYMRLHFKRLYLLAAPLHAVDKSVAGGMIIVYDTAYIRAEIFRVWSRAFVHIAGQVLVIVAITLLIVRWSLAGPIARAAQWMKTLHTGRHAIQPQARDLDFLQPLAREVAPLAESMRQAHAAAEMEARLRNTNESLWTAQRLADHVRTKLDGSRLFVVSNREPYVHNRQGNAIRVTVPASGLVTAIEPILRACNGTWVAQGSGNADKETVDGHDRLQVPPDDPRYTLRRVWLSAEEEEGYYYGFANEGLWPLCHMAH